MKQSFINALLSGAMLWSSLASAQFTPPKDECDNPNFAASPVSGAPWTKGDGKGYFCDTKWKSGYVICGIQTWAYKYNQKGFKVKYSDGTWGPLHGNTMQEYDKDNWTGDYSKNTIEWDCAAPLKDLRMISNWPGFGKYRDEGLPDAVGGIRLTTPDGKDYFIHGDIGSFPGTTFDMASGFLVGARGRSGGFVDTLEWRLMASPVQSAEIKSMKFKKDLTALNKSPDKVQEMSLANLWFVNGDDKNDAPYKVTNDQEEKTSSAITHSTSHEFGVDVKITVSADLKVPFLSEGKFESSVGTSYKMTKTDTSATTTEHNTKLSWAFEGKVKPKSAMFCKAWTFKGQYEDGYTATVLIKFKNGQSIEVEQDGQFMSVGWTSAVTRCDPQPYKDAPADAHDVSPTKSRFRMLKTRAIGAH